MIADLSAAADLAKQLDACTEPDWHLLGLWADAEFGGHEAIQWAIATGLWPLCSGWYPYGNICPMLLSRLPLPRSETRADAGVFNFRRVWKVSDYFRLLVDRWPEVESYAFSQDHGLTNGDVRRA